MVIALLLVLSGALQEKTPEDRPIRKGDTVILRGCLTGGVVEAGELSSSDGNVKHLLPHDYRLTGKKDLLKALKEAHMHHVDAITGVLKTDLPVERKGMGGRIGNTSVGIGVGNPQASTQRALPVVEVKSFEHVDIRCR
jgi:hypothetical protein